MKRIVIAVGFVLTALSAGCYDRPDCSFKCGEEAACPFEYYCAPDNRCKLKGVEPDLVCDPSDVEPDAGAGDGGDPDADSN